MKVLAGIVIAFLVLIGATVVFRLWREGDALATSASATQAKLGKDQGMNQNLLAELEYLSHPENLLKELRARYNLHFPGEHTIIIVPSNTSTAP